MRSLDRGLRGWLPLAPGRALLLILTISAALRGAAGAEPGAAPQGPPPEYVEVTATRIPEDAATVPASITIVKGDELRSRGARDLRSALALAAGIDISPGGDAGPASGVPEIWGLREFDAFLLVVDGVPWGGAFNPALASISLNDVERIEVLRGAAPVMYGATSFVGVIQVIHRAAGSRGAGLALSGASYGSGSIAGRTSLPPWRRIVSSVSAEVQREGFKDDRTGFDRAHLLWRSLAPVSAGTVRADFDASWLRQDPASPTPRLGEDLSTAVPLDSNQNMQGARLDERRLTFTGGYDLPVRAGTWSTLASVSQGTQGILRGFLTDVSTTRPNANGERETIDTTDFYLDSHVEVTTLPRVRIVGGVDRLYGHGKGNGGDFDYFARLDGDHPPDANRLVNAADVKIHDTRSFTGFYGNLEYLPYESLRLEAGWRLDRTEERRAVSSLEFGDGLRQEGSDRRALRRGSGAAGATWTAWRRPDDDLRLYLSYRNTYKPAAIDFGLDSDSEILDPETAVSWEGGAKSRLSGGRLECAASVFQMDFDNLVVPTSRGGLPALANAGRTRFRGLEAEVAWKIAKDLLLRTTGSLHDARFRRFVAEFGGVPTQLAGNRQEMSPRWLASTGVVWSPPHGWTGSVEANYVGSRYLDKRNNALTPAYLTWSAGIGYRSGAWELRLDGTNLNDQRPPVSESELGDAQYYRLPARRMRLTGIWTL